VATAPVSTPALEDALADFFRAARRARGRANRRTAPGEMSLAQWHLVEPLLDGPQPGARLAEAADVSAPTASRMIESLVARGHVERVACGEDRRVVRIGLTAPGRRAALAKRREIQRMRKRVVEALPEGDRERAAEILARLAEIVEEL
jgi:DNA-binding MarR family transcriptional regulator